LGGMNRSTMAKKSQPKAARAVWPSAAIEAWYRTQLQTMVRDMSTDLYRMLKAAWNTREPVSDARPIEAAGVMFRNAEGRILLLHRTDGRGWAFPGGGIEQGEQPMAAARREAGEETGMGSNVQLFPFDVRTTDGVRFHTYEAIVGGEFDPILNHEHDAFVWIKPESIRCIDLHPGVFKTLFCGADIAQDAKKRPSINLLRRALSKWGDIWTQRLESLSDKMANEFANKSRAYTDRALKQAFSEAGLTVKFQPTKGMLEGYAAVVSENVQLIKSIPQKYLTDVQSVVWTNVMKGGDLKAMAEGIEHTYGVTKRRAAFIARDQNNKAKAVFERERDAELGVTEFIWVHSHAGKEPRPTHVRANGKKYSLAKGMYDSDEGKYVFPGELINCRCTQRAILPGWDD
jgi:SPP1 gp7 family putative phage head morphogenesis protein